MTANIVYLHGFASSPKSKKAQYFKQRFETHDVNVYIPDLNVPSFERLTLTDMLETVAGVVRMCPPGPVYMVGSSLGGLTALHFINQYKDAEAKRVELLFLLAPALDFIANRRQTMGESSLEEWQKTGWWHTHHYATDSQARVHYALVDDIARYDSFSAHLIIPTIIYHGENDDTVPPEQSVRFAEPRNNVTLKLVDSDHKLHDQAPAIFDHMVKFFAL